MKYKLPNDETKLAKIAFLLMLNGRDVVSVVLLLKKIYHKDNVYFIHIDQNQALLRYYLSELAQLHTNVHVFSWSMHTIWGGSSLLQAYLRAFSEMISLGGSWDFVINISESDFLLRNVEDLMKFLGSNLQKNFVKTSGLNIKEFVGKQGLKRAFVECDSKMIAVEDRALPLGLVLDGGSDWFCLSRDFVGYVTIAATNQAGLVLNMVEYFQHVLLPAEMFFHTLLQSSRQFCRNTVVNSNLRLTNWQRERGCRCQHSQTVIGWCGCSPSVLTSDQSDVSKLLWTLQTSPDIFLARKFDRTIDSDILQNNFDVHSSSAVSIKAYSKCLSRTEIFSNYRHISNYFSSFQDPIQLYRDFNKQIRLLASSKSNQISCRKSSSVDHPLTDHDYHMFLLYPHHSNLTKSNTNGDILLVQSHNQSISSISVIGYYPSNQRIIAPVPPLTQVTISQNYDVKENIFRTPLYLVNAKSSLDSLTLELRFDLLSGSSTLKYLERQSLHLSLVSPSKVQVNYKLPALNYNSSMGNSYVTTSPQHQLIAWFSSFELDDPLEWGSWRCIVYSDRFLSIVGGCSFFVVNNYKGYDATGPGALQYMAKQWRILHHYDFDVARLCNITTATLGSCGRMLSQIFDLSLF